MESKRKGQKAKRWNEGKGRERDEDIKMIKMCYTLA